MYIYRTSLFIHILNSKRIKPSRHKNKGSRKMSQTTKSKLRRQPLKVKFSVIIEEMLRTGHTITFKVVNSLYIYCIYYEGGTKSVSLV